VEFAKGRAQERRLDGHLRSFAREPIRQHHIMLVGNKGFVARLNEEDVIAFDSGTQQSLCAVSFNLRDRTALIVGNAGTILLWDEDKFDRIDPSTSENLRSAV
jgi:hypothetical protein